MGSFHENMIEYRKQLEKGAIKEAYRGLMDFMVGLRSYFAKNILIILYLEAFILDIWI